MEKDTAAQIEAAVCAALIAQEQRRRADRRRLLRPVLACLMVVAGVFVTFALFNVTRGFIDARQQHREEQWRAGINRTDGRSVEDMKAAR